MKNIDRVIERARSLEHCGEYVSTSRSCKSVKATPCQVPCSRYGTLNGEQVSGNCYVKDSRCDATCSYKDCDSYLPF